MGRKPAAPPEAAEPALALGVLEQFVGFRLRRVHNRLVQTFAEKLEPYELRPAAYTALALIAANPGVAQVALARTALFDKALVVGLVDELEARGCVERRRSPEDGRRHALYATAEGERLLAELTELAQRNEAWIVQALPQRESRRLLALLDRVYAAGPDGRREGD